jgi:hypothetical protein
MFRESKFWYDFCIIFQGIEDAILGSTLYLVKPSDDSKDIEEPILEDKKRHD